MKKTGTDSHVTAVVVFACPQLKAAKANLYKTVCAAVTCVLAFYD